MKDGQLTMKQAAALARLSTTRIRQLWTFGQIKGGKHGRRVFIDEASLKQYLIKTYNVDEGGTALDGWNEKLQMHCVFQQPSGEYIANHWRTFD